MTKLLATVLAASAALSVAPAAAAVEIVTGDYSLDFGNSNIAKGPFTDTISFNFTTAGTAEIGLSYFFRTTGLTNLSATFNGQTISLAPSAPGSKFYVGSLSQTFSSGPQQLVLSGLSNGPSSAYAGTLSFSAVPEPGSWALMIIGVGAMGMVLRSRKYRATKVSFA